MRNKDGTFAKGYLQGKPFKTGQVSLRKGVKLSDEIKQKISLSKKGQASFKGKKHTEETKAKIRNTKITNTPRGEKSHRWKGGVSKIDKIIRRLHENIVWRSNVFERDQWTCQTCGIRGVYVTAHHIKSFALILKENKIIDSNQARKCLELWDIKNGVTLCEACHSLTDNYKARGKLK